MNKITRILIVLMVLASSIGIAQAVTISSEISKNNYKQVIFTVAFTGTEETNQWKIMIVSKQDYNNGQNGIDPDYPYFVEMLPSGEGNGERSFILHEGDYKAFIALKGIGEVDYTAFTIVAPVTPTPTPSPTPTPTPSPTPSPTPTPEPTPSPTPTPTPSPTPSPTPTPEPTPPPTPTATPAPTQAPSPPSSSHGSSGGSVDQTDFSGFGSGIDGCILVVNSTPKDAQVFINGQLLGTTPFLKRGFRTGRGFIEIRKEGYYNYSKNINPDNGDTVEISIVLEPIKQKNETVVSLPAYNNQSNDTTNDTVIVMPPATNNGNLPSFAIFAIVVIFAIGALIVFRNSGKFGLTRGKSIDTRIDTDLKEIEDKDDVKSDEQIISSLIRRNPDIPVADISDQTGISVRTVYRRINEMKKENRLPS